MTTLENLYEAIITVALANGYTPEQIEADPKGCAEAYFAALERMRVADTKLIKEMGAKEFLALAL